MEQEAAKLPRSVRKGPLITLTCECGRSHELHYGERRKCEGCGRTWNTSKIPLDEYAAIRRTQVRYRIFPLVAGVLLLAAMVVFFVEGHTFRAVIAIPFLLASWSMFGRPFFRSRYRKALSKSLPTWNIEPD